jgi:1-acyl-sn-glycerol-3-phosphate acyltransferase
MPHTQSCSQQGDETRTHHRSHPNPRLRSLRLPGEIQQPSLYYRFARRCCQLSMTALFQQRVYHRHREPTTGGVLYVANHQSFLDPVLVTNTLRRPGNYMARDSLFRHPLFGRLIESLNAFPIRRGTADTAALKEAMRRLRTGRCVVVFPEGTRTRDGRIGPFLPGIAVLAQRAADWTVPVLIDGAYEAWPRSQALPRPGRIAIEYGRPMPQDQTRRLTPQELVDRLRTELLALQADLRRRMGRPTICYPADERDAEADSLPPE